MNAILVTFGAGNGYRWAGRNCAHWLQIGAKGGRQFESTTEDFLLSAANRQAGVIGS